jgi:hypothetical protein
MGGEDGLPTSFTLPAATDWRRIRSVDPDALTLAGRFDGLPERAVSVGRHPPMTPATHGRPLAPSLTGTGKAVKQTITSG